MYPLVINLRIGISSGNFLPRMFVCFSHAYETSLVFFHPETVEGGLCAVFFLLLVRSQSNARKGRWAALPVGILKNAMCAHCLSILAEDVGHGGTGFASSLSEALGHSVADLTPKSKPASLLCAVYQSPVVCTLSPGCLLIKANCMATAKKENFLCTTRC